MATTRSKRITKPRVKTDSRRKSKLKLAGEATQRGLLLVTLKACDWNLTAAARELDLTGPADVIRSLKTLGLTEEYDAAKARGDVSPGSRTKQ